MKIHGFLKQGMMFQFRIKNDTIILNNYARSVFRKVFQSNENCYFLQLQQV